MKKILLMHFGFFLFRLSCLGQENEVHYYNRYENEIRTDSTNCYFYKVGKFTTKFTWFDTVKAFYCNSLKLKSIEFYTEKGRQGYSYYYYPNGALIEKVLFIEGFPSGVVESYYWNGRKKETKEYPPSNQIKLRSKLDFLLVNAWDSLGTQMVKNYEGYFKNKIEEGKIKNGLHDSIWTTYNDSGEKIVVEKYNQGNFVEGKRYSKGGTIHFTEQEVSAAPKGGLENLYKKIGTNLKYPHDARRKGIQGKVFVKFIIEPDGGISNVETVKGVYPSINEEAVRVIKLCGPWIPGYQRGAAVRQAFTLPLVFKLK